jgi:predicted nuclease with TOPRIM domain
MNHNPHQRNGENGRLAEDIDRVEDGIARVEEDLERLEEDVEALERDVGQRARTFHIEVNHNKVVITGRVHTGLDIKRAAIEQQVRIALDFVLSQERPNGRMRLVSDTDRVVVTDRSRFEAIPNDDHS